MQQGENDITQLGKELWAESDLLSVGVSET